MSFSVNSNYGALVALQNINSTNRDLDQVQNRISTGLKVGSARDNGAIFAIAEGQRGRVSALGSVRDGIDRANTVIDTALSAGGSIGTILQELRTKAVDAQQSDLSAAQKATLQQDFASLRAQINQVANAATFNGANLLNGTNSSISNQYNVLTSDIGGSTGGTGNFVVKGAAISTTDITSASQVVSDITGLDANDSVTFTFGYQTTSTSDDTSLSVSIKAGETVEAFVNRIGTATSGRVTASFDGATGRISYSSTESFRTTATVASTDTTASAFLGANRTANSTAGGYTITTSQAVAGEYTSAPGVFGDSPLTALAAAPLGTSAIADSENANAAKNDLGFATDDVITFTDGGGNTLGAIAVGTLTFDEFAAQVSVATDGAVTATYSQAGGFAYASAEDFSVTVTNSTDRSGAAIDTASITTDLGAGAAIAPDLAGTDAAIGWLNQYNVQVGDTILLTNTTTTTTTAFEIGASTTMAQFLAAINGAGDAGATTYVAGAGFGSFAAENLTIDFVEVDPTTAAELAFEGTGTTAPAVIGISAESTDIVGAGTGLADNDSISFFDSNGNIIGSAVTLTDAGVNTVQEFIDTVYTNTSGRIQAQLNDDGTISYRGSDVFTVNYTESDTATAGTVNANAGAVLAGSSTNSQFQLKTATAFTTGTTGSTALTTALATLAADDTFQVLDANGDAVGSAIAVGTLTIDTFLAELQTQSGGTVVGTFDAATRTITYASESGFRIDFTDTSAGGETADEFVGNSTSGDIGVAGRSSTSAYTAGTGGSSSASGPSRITITGYDFRTDSGSALSALASLDVQTDASSAVAAIDAAILTLNDGLAKLGSQGRALDIQKDFLQALQDNVEKGIGALVDADLAKESARLQSLQIKQQLGVQALSIANQSPQIILSLFQ